MNIFTRILNYFRGNQPPKPSNKGAFLAGKRARTSVDNPSETTFSTFVFKEQTDKTLIWRTMNLDSRTLSRISPQELVELLADVSPEISSALWHFLRFTNPGFEVQALDADGEIVPSGQEAIKEMITIMNELYGSFDVVVGRLFIGAFIRGAFLGEVVLSNNGQEFVDLVTPDPWTITFKETVVPDRGKVWEIGQRQGGIFVSLNIPTVRYIPIDPLPGQPQGRAMMAPAMFVTLFIIGLLHDLRRVVAQQGYPRLDLKVNLEELAEAMPADLENDPKAYMNWVNDIISEIETVYRLLEPDDAYVHTSVVEVNSPVGAINSDLKVVDDISRLLERMATRALKTMPLLMGSNEAVSETHANRQWEIHAATIKSVQHLCETLLEGLFDEALRGQGIAAKTKFRFAELRASEELRDAQTEAQNIQNAWNKYQAGWISQDQASELVTDAPADQSLPRQAITPTIAVVPDGGGDGAMRGAGIYGQRAVQIIPDGSEQPLPPLPTDIPDEELISEHDKDRAIELWDSLMPEYKDMLEAEVIGQTDFDQNSRGLRQGKPLWTWNQNTKRYREKATGRFVGQKKMTDLRNDFIVRQKERLAAGSNTLTDQLAAGDITIQRWVLDQRQIIKETYVDQYVLGKGGRNNMTQVDWGRVGAEIKKQYGFLQGFGQDIADGKMSVAGIKARSGLYIDSSTQMFELGRSASFGLTLPEHPADGSQICKSNCKCEWVIVEFDDRFEATWMLNPAEHCDTCLGNAGRWDPLIVSKSDVNSRKKLFDFLGGINGR